MTGEPGRARDTGLPSAGVVLRTVLIFLLVAGNARGAGTGAWMYNEANALYRHGEFKTAAGRYEDLVSRVCGMVTFFSIWAMPFSRPEKSDTPFWPMSGPSS